MILELVAAIIVLILIIAYGYRIYDQFKDERKKKDKWKP